MKMVSWGVAEQGWRKGPWTPEEDKLLVEYVSSYGEGRWSSVSKCAGLNRSGKSCRLRWVNYLRPGLKKGHITPQEEGIIIELHALWGNKWSTIARYLPGRTDNEIKNYWRTHFKKRKSCCDEINHEEKRKIRCQKQEESNVVEEEEAVSECRSNDELMMPMTHHQDYGWCDFAPVDNCFNIGGLWDMDHQNGCTKMAIQNQPNIIANGGGDHQGNYMCGGGYIYFEMESN